MSLPILAGIFKDSNLNKLKCKTSNLKIPVSKTLPNLAIGNASRKRAFIRGQRVLDLGRIRNPNDEGLRHCKNTLLFRVDM